MPYKPGDITKGAASKAGDAALGAARTARRRVFEEAAEHGVHWWKLPLPGQLAALAMFREDLREWKLTRVVWVADPTERRVLRIPD